MIWDYRAKVKLSSHKCAQWLGLLVFIVVIGVSESFESNFHITTVIFEQHIKMISGQEGFISVYIFDGKSSSSQVFIPRSLRSKVRSECKRKLDQVRLQPIKIGRVGQMADNYACYKSFGTAYNSTNGCRKPTRLHHVIYRI